MITRGFRNNNPGNLILTNIPWEGKVPNSENTDGKFEQFVSMAYGIRAMIIDIVGDINKKGLDTLTKLINEYAPSFENNTKGYIDRVSKATGLKPNEKISLSNELLRELIEAKIEVENGLQSFNSHYDRRDFEKALSLLPITTKSQIQIAKVINNSFFKVVVILLVSLLILLLYKKLK